MMQPSPNAVQLLWDALFLRPEAYAAMRDDRKPFTRGLIILLGLGLVLALVGIVSTTLEWAAGPSLEDIQTVILDNLRQMTWWSRIEIFPEARAQFDLIWNQVWRVMRAVIPTPASSVVGLITQPLFLIVGWLLIGLLAHLLARLFGGRAALNQTLGTTALAAAPQLLNLVTVLPYTAVAGLGAWTLLCMYMALRTAHGLSWPRAVWAAVLPPILLAVILGIVFGAGFALLAPTFSTLFAGGQ